MTRFSSWRYWLCTFSWHDWRPYCLGLLRCNFCGAGRRG